MNLIDNLKLFEQELDNKLKENIIFKFDSKYILSYLFNMSDRMSHTNHESNIIDYAIATTGKHLISGKSGEITNLPDNLDDLVKQIEFCAHYFMFRDYIYYLYNSKDPFNFYIEENKFIIKFKDPSIPRQFFNSHNEYFLSSTKLKYNDLDEKIKKDILKLNEFKISVKHKNLLEKIEKIAHLKINEYFSIIDKNSTIDLGGYTYCEFYKVYHALVAKALYHRYFGSEKKTYGAINFNEKEIIEAFSQDLNIDQNKIKLIFSNLVYDYNSVKAKLDASYYSLYKDKSTEIIFMRPFHFSIYEGIVSFLRVIAIKNPALFSNTISGAVGKEFVNKIKKIFQSQSFICLSEVKLSKYNSTLPDIDLLVISKEPTLGYILLVCEIKAPIPPKWAKDQLKALEEDNISKAFKQSSKISEFLQTSVGISFLTDNIPKDQFHDFDNFIVVIEPLIITSHNNGMFFSKEKTPIFSYRTIDAIVSACDGDMAYIQKHIHTYNDFVDKNIKTKMMKVDLGRFKVEYEILDESPLIYFPKNKWNSSEIKNKYIQSFKSENLTPYLLCQIK